MQIKAILSALIINVLFTLRITIVVAKKIIKLFKCLRAGPLNLLKNNFPVLYLKKATFMIIAYFFLNAIPDFDKCLNGPALICTPSYLNILM